MPDDREVDPERSRRQRTAAKVLAVLDAPAIARPLQINEVWGRLVALGNDFLAGLQSAMKVDGDDGELLASASALTQLRDDIAGAPRLRPWLVAWTGAEQTALRLEASLRLFVSAASTQGALEGQRLAREAQSALDAAAEPIGSVAEQLRIAEALQGADSLEEALAIIGHLITTRLKDTGIVRVDASAADYVTRITGSRCVPPGAGLSIALLVAEVEWGLDEERFWSVAASFFDSLATDEVRLRHLLSSDEWRADFRRALIRSYDATVGLSGALASARHTRHEVDALMTATHALIEGAAKHLMATLITMVDGSDYLANRTRDASDLIRTIAGWHPVVDLDGIDRTIRVAEAHDEFTLQGEFVEFTARTAQYRRLSVPQLVDRMLAARETTVAWVAATCAALASLEIDVPAVDPEAELGLDAAGLIGLLTALGGVKDVVVVIDGAVLTISGAIDLDPTSLGVVVPLLHVLPSDVEVVRVVSSLTGSELAGPIPELRQALASEGELSKEVLYWVAWTRWMLDGEQLLSSDQLRKVVSVRALEIAAEGDARQTIAALRLFRDTSRILGDDPLASALDACIKWRREAVLGTNDKQLPQELVKWASMRVQIPFE